MCVCVCVCECECIIGPANDWFLNEEEEDTTMYLLYTIQNFPEFSVIWF